MQVFIILFNLICRDKCTTGDHWVENHNPTAVLLDVPICFRITGIARYELDFCRITVKKYPIALLYLFPRLVFEDKWIHAAAFGVL